MKRTAAERAQDRHLAATVHGFEPGESMCCFLAGFKAGARLPSAERLAAERAPDGTDPTMLDTVEAGQWLAAIRRLRRGVKGGRG